MSLNKIGQGVGGQVAVSLTGAAVTATGTGAVTISELVTLDAPGSINFGSGVSVPEGSVNCLLQSDGVGQTCTGASPTPGRFVIRNHGNVDIDVKANSDKGAATLLGGTGPSLQWKASVKDTGAGSAEVSAFTEVVALTDTYIVGNLKSGDTEDEMWFDLSLTVPDNALPGAKSLTITFTACKDVTPNTPSFVAC
ncbi:MAG TPA: hypothetical protein VI894_03295 [Candidatus Nanoarchaeia archaeon]|nr:hypothetical protein [Candidatus Nanoarchaeia archaeon]